MPLTLLASTTFDSDAKVAKWYYTANSLAGGICDLRWRNDGTDSFVEIEFGTPPAGAVGFATKAAMDANLAHAAGITAYCFDPDPAKHGRYTKSGASGTGSWGSRVGNVQDKAWPDPNHTRVAWLELLFQSWAANVAGTGPRDAGAPTTKWGIASTTNAPNLTNLVNGEFRYRMRAIDLMIGENVKIVQHVQTADLVQGADWNPATQRAFVNALQIANPISDQLGFGKSGYYGRNPVRGVHNSGWVDVRVPFRAVDSDWVQLGGLEGRQGLPGDPVRYYNYVVTPPSQFLASFTGNAYMVCAHKVVDAATKTTAPTDADRIQGTLQINKFEVWTQQ